MHGVTVPWARVYQCCPLVSARLRDRTSMDFAVFACGFPAVRYDACGATSALTRKGKAPRLHMPQACAYCRLMLAPKLVDACRKVTPTCSLQRYVKLCQSVCSSCRFHQLPRKLCLCQPLSPSRRRSKPRTAVPYAQVFKPARLHACD